MQGNFDKARSESSLKDDEFREAQLAVVGTSFDTRSSHAVASSIKASALESNLSTVPLSVAAPAGETAASVKAHAALEPRMWKLYCQTRKMQS